MGFDGPRPLRHVGDTKEGNEVPRNDSMASSRCAAGLAAISVIVSVSCGGKTPPLGGQTSPPVSSETSSPTTAPLSPPTGSPTTPTTTSVPPLATTGYGLPGCYYSYHDPHPGAERPKDFVLQGCMQNGFWLTDMSWSSWGPRGADGTGTFVVNTCEIDCASGPAVSSPVVVHSWNPKPAQAGSHCPPNLNIYAELILAFPKTLPPATQIQINTKYRGMAAVHNPSDVSAFCE